MATLAGRLPSGWSGSCLGEGNNVQEFRLAASAYSEGESVQVWSNTYGDWMFGEVDAVFLTDTNAGGYSVTAGTVKVTSQVGVKWVVPENMETQLRKVPRSPRRREPASTADVPPPPAGVCARPGAGGSGSSGNTSGDATLCKRGCGRPVQPGMSRGLYPYDTCCKRCALHPGAHVHDENCGQTKTAGCPAEEAHPTMKRLLEGMLEDRSEYVNGAFSKASQGGDHLDRAQVAAGLQELLAPFSKDITEDYLGDMCSKHRGKGPVGPLGLAQFSTLCQAVLEDRKAFWFPKILSISTKDFVRKNAQALKDVYRLGKQLGRGSFGVVYEATHIVSKEQRVCKKIETSGKTGLERDHILGEIGNMAMLDHPNVIKVYEYFDDGEFVSQIIEQCKGGELQRKVDELRETGNATYDEAFICDIMKQTLRALAFMHKKGLLHKDLKPQNIMMVDRTSSSIKVIDFGLAELFNPSQEFASSVAGTLLYLAPEVFREHQQMTMKIDVWSAGVILYNLLTGDFPFMEAWRQGIDEAWWQEQTKEKIKHADPTVHGRLSQASRVCSQLLWQMLSKDVQARPDAALCLEHPWFERHSEVAPTLSVGVVQCVEGYARMSDLKKAIFLLIAHQCDVEALPEIRALFTHFDLRNRGCLSTADLHNVLVKSGIGGLRAERVLHALDRDDDGQITWTEFTAAVICVSVGRDPKFVDAAFATIDADRDGKISAEDLARVLAGPESREDWRQRLPTLFQEVLSPGLVARPLQDALRGFATSLLPTPRGSRANCANLAQFRKYMAREVELRPGDALWAVT